MSDLREMFENMRNNLPFEEIIDDWVPFSFRKMVEEKLSDTSPGLHTIEYHTEEQRKYVLKKMKEKQLRENPPLLTFRHKVTGALYLHTEEDGTSVENRQVLERVEL